MKLLKIEDNSGHFLKASSQYESVSKLTKEDLLKLVEWSLHEEEIEIDAYDENTLKNQAHRVIYKSISLKLLALRQRRQEFLDRSARLFLDEFEKYRASSK